MRHSLRLLSPTLLIAAIPCLLTGTAQLALAHSTAITTNDNREDRANDALDGGDYKTAITLYSQLIAEKSDNVNLYFNRSIAYLQTGQNNKSLTDLNTFLRLMPKSADGYLLRAELYRRMKKLDEALADINKVETLDISKMDYELRGEIYLNKGDNKAAIADLNRATALPSKHIDFTYLLLGDAYWANNQLTDAMAAYTKCIAIRPQKVNGYAQRYRLYLQNNEIDRALADAEQYLALKPDSSQGYWMRASAFTFKHAPEADILAIKDFKKALSLEKNIQKHGNGIANMAAVQLRLKDNSGVITSLNTMFRWEQENPKSVGFALFTRGVAYGNIKKYAESIADFSEYIKRFPNGKFINEARYNLASDYVHCTPCEADKTIALLDKVIAANPKYAKAYDCRSMAYQEKKQYEKAIEDCKAVLRYAKPEDRIAITAYENMALAYDSLAAEPGNTPVMATKALAAMKKYHTLAPEDKLALLYYCELTQRYGDVEVRIDVLTNCLNKLSQTEISTRVDLLYQRAQAFSEKEEWQKAAADFRQVLALRPNNAMAITGVANMYFLPTPPDYNKAAAMYLRAIQSDPKYIPAYYGRMFTNFHLKQYKEAIADAEIVLKSDVPQPLDVAEAFLVEALSYGSLANAQGNDKALGSKALAAIKRYTSLKSGNAQDKELQDYLVNLYEKDKVVSPADAATALTMDRPKSLTKDTPSKNVPKVSKEAIDQVVFDTDAPEQTEATTPDRVLVRSPFHFSAVLPATMDTTLLNHTMVMEVSVATDGSATWKITQGCGNAEADAIILKTLTDSQWKPTMGHGKSFSQKLDLTFSPKSASATSSVAIDFTEQAWLERFVEAKPIQWKNPQFSSDVDRTLVKSVKVEFTISASGTCVYKIVTGSGNIEVDAAVLKACASYRWQPATRGGKPVEQTQILIFNPSE